jgi:hypothetical protein
LVIYLDTGRHWYDLYDRAAYYGSFLSAIDAAIDAAYCYTLYATDCTAFDCTEYAAV